MNLKNKMINHFLALKLVQNMSFNYPCPRKLRQVVKMSMIQRQPAHKIKDIWSQYHQPRQANIAQTIQKHQYVYLLERAKKSPMFLLPVHRKGGHFKLLTQWQDNCFLCTSLEDFKRYGANAHPYIVFTIFNQILFSKGLALLRGDIVNYMLTKLQAQKLWSLLLRSYMQQQYFQMVDSFNHRTEMFDQQKYDSLFHLQ